MRKLFALAFLLTSLFLVPYTQAQGDTSSNDSYLIKNFESDITLQKDTTLLVKEKIVVNFPTPKHGIYRIIPVSYTESGRTINANLRVISVTDESGTGYKYVTSRLNQSLQLKIGDANKTLTGQVSYLITYTVSKVVLQYSDHDEVYWNVTGNEWDTNIDNAQASLTSPYAKITSFDCFAGAYKSQEKYCRSERLDDKLVIFDAKTTLGSGKDFTVVIGLDKANSLVFPSPLQQFISDLFDNISYLIAFLPLLIMSIFWYKKGRDKKYASDNIYYKPDDAKVITKPLFAREFLPTVYSPIQGLTPSQLGTIVDEKVDIQDVVAEIVEMARIGFIKIIKIDYKTFLKSNVDYAFVKTEKYSDQKSFNQLFDYQKYLLRELFRSTVIEDSIAKAEKLFKDNPGKENEVQWELAKNEYVLLSGLKNHFYEGLPIYKDKIYENLTDKGYFAGNPETVRQLWMCVWLILWITAGFAVKILELVSGNNISLILLLCSALPALFIIRSMPRKTALGYSLYRQAEGLAYYLAKGKWRYEIEEKELFIEEILPLAISLGVVDKLAGDMKDLGLEPPRYFGGSSAALFAGDFLNFNSVSAKNFVSSPGGKWSGSSSWSGGSGFSGGFSGGGFGGGGGGSW